jgi:hypothetical protein
MKPKRNKSQKKNISKRKPRSGETPSAPKPQVTNKAPRQARWKRLVPFVWPLLAWLEKSLLAWLERRGHDPS